MKCHDVRRRWNLFYDSEGDPALQFQIGEHLEMCPECTQWYERQSCFEATLSEKLCAEPATPEVWRRVLARSDLQHRPVSRRGVLAVSGAVGVAVLVLLFALVIQGTAVPEADLTALTASWHERFVNGQSQVDLHSKSDLEVEGYLRRRVDFPVRCPPRKNAGFAVEGTGVCELAGERAAYLVGRVEETPVSIFILAKESLSNFPRQYEALRSNRSAHHQEGRYRMVLDVIDQNLVLVIGRTDAKRLLKVLSAYGTYPEHRVS